MCVRNVEKEGRVFWGGTWLYWSQVKQGTTHCDRDLPGLGNWPMNQPCWWWASSGYELSSVFHWGSLSYFLQHWYSSLSFYSLHSEPRQAFLDPAPAGLLTLLWVRNVHPRGSILGTTGLWGTFKGPCRALFIFCWETPFPLQNSSTIHKPELGNSQLFFCQKQFFKIVRIIPSSSIPTGRFLQRAIHLCG